LPSTPYRGIHPFRPVDQAIFFARDEETRRLVGLVSVYRGVLLYGDSGSGKSSLVNAGLIPEARRLEFSPERLRVQPRAGEELVVERSTGEEDEDEDELLPSVLAPDEDSSARMVLAIDAFEERVRAACEQCRPLLIFDQFEEIVTLFDEAGASDARRRLVEFIVRLLRGSLPVKVLLSFREDYLGRVKELLSACPELVDQALRIAPPTSEALPTIIRGPFDRYPDHFARQLSAVLTDRLVTVLAERFGVGDVSLSEVQIVCLRLWQSDDPEALLAEKGLQGILEDYLGEALDGMPTQLRAAATLLLAQMVTSAGTRNVISAGDLLQRAQEQEDDITPGLLNQALEDLSQSKLLRRERRRDLDLYEITSESLVPWISRRRSEFRQLQERRRVRRHLLILGSIAAALLLVAGALAVVAIFAVHSRNEAKAAKRDAQAQRNVAIADRVAGESEALTRHEPQVAQLLAVAAWRIAGTKQARASLLNALAQPDRCVMIRQGYGPLHAVAFSSNGKVLVTAGPGNTARVWDVQACHHIHTFIFSTAVDSVALSPDGKTLAIALAGGTAQLWDVATPKEDGGPLDAGPGRVTRVAFSQDGKILATANSVGTVRLWDVATHRLIGAPLSGGRGPVTGVAFSRDDETLVTADAGGTVRLWRVPAGRQIHAFKASRHGPVYSVAFSPHGQTLATAGADGTARLWDVATGREKGRQLKVSELAVRAVAFSPDGKTLATAGVDGITRLWIVATHKRIRGAPLTVGAITVYAMAFSPRGKTLATVNAAGTVRLWDPAVYRQISPSLAAGHASAYSVAFRRGGKILATAGADGTARLWRVPTGRQIHAFKASRHGPVYSVAFSRDGSTLATGGADGTARLWNVVSGQEKGAPLKVSDLPVRSVAFSPDGKTLATGSADGTARLWDVVSGRAKGAPLKVSHLAVRSVAFSPDGKTLATASADGEAKLWDVAKQRRIGKPFPNSLPLESVAFAPHSPVLATAGDDGKVIFWNDTALRRSKANMMIGTSMIVRTPVYSVAFSPDGRILATASADGRARLWDRFTHQRIGAALAAGPGSVTSVAFSPNGKILATASLGGGTRLWNVFLPHHPVDHVCSIVQNALTRAQWKTYIVGGAPFRIICPGNPAAS